MAPNVLVPIAIVGIGLQFSSGATDTGKLWDLLRKGRNVWKKTPRDRYNEDAFYHPSLD